MSEKFESTLECNECGGSSAFDLSMPGADPRCPLCGAFQMKADQVIAYGKSVASLLESGLIPAGESERIGDMVTRFFWLAERRGVRSDESTVAPNATASELQSLAPRIGLIVEALAKTTQPS
jgi:hypothetical protein